ncbi:Flp pilus assembly protein CpaB [Aquipuribacter nitratireducens]|uniref:Flp pilus assembly protein CpaB n=1 Tax=Aquipuribacter nitratireducens TaxID=650104 RepID=A0ABW0GQJ9_9MICO
MGARVLVLVVALVVAALGALAVVLYVENALGRQDAATETLEVLVVAETIPAGTAFADVPGSLEVATRPADAVPQGVLDPADGLTGQVALQTLYPGEVVSAPVVGDPDDVTALAPPDGRFAASFAFPAANRVGTFVRPGSQVSVFATVETVAPGPDGEVVTALTTQLLVEALDVLAVGSTTDIGAESGAGGGDAALVTFAVDQGEVQRLVLAQSIGTLYLALAGEEPPIEQLEGTTRLNLFEATS